MCRLWLLHVKYAKGEGKRKESVDKPTFIGLDSGVEPNINFHLYILLLQGLIISTMCL